MNNRNHQFIGGTDACPIVDGVFATAEAILYTLPVREVVEGEVVDALELPGASVQPDMHVLDQEAFVDVVAVTPPPDEMLRIRNIVRQQILERMRKEGIFLVAGQNGIVPYFSDILAGNGIPREEWVEFVFDALATFHYELRDAEHAKQKSLTSHVAA